MWIKGIKFGRNKPRDWDYIHPKDRHAATAYTEPQAFEEKPCICRHVRDATPGN